MDTEEAGEALRRCGNGRLRLSGSPGLRLAALLLVGLLGTGCVHGEQHSSEDTQVVDQGKPKPGGAAAQSPPPMPAASRKAPPKIEAIRVAGVRYEQVLNAELLGEPQRTGYLAAYDDASSERLWLVRVYEVSKVEHLEADVQDVFFTRMALRPDSQSIEIENELGALFEVDLASRRVSRLNR